MEVYSKNLLMTSGKKQYTLTVVLSPGDASCILTYNGVAHTSTTATVDSGTVISYSITKSPYGTTTGTITMDANKTLTATGVTQTGSLWTQPALTENGTLGQGNFAVSTSHRYSAGTDIWKAFDQSTGYYQVGGTGTSYIPIIVKLYINPAIKITNFNFENNTYANCAANAGNIYGSNTDSNYNLITSFTNSVQSARATWDVSLSNNTNYYKIT